jgi:hypothetical protein
VSPVVIPGGEIMKRFLMVYLIMSFVVGIAGWAFLLCSDTEAADFVRSRMFLADNSGTYYTSKSYVVYPDGKGSEAITQLDVSPNSTWKWNDKYPHKFTVENGQVLDKNFEKSGEIAIVTFLLRRPKKPTTVTIVGKFGVCSSKTCVVLRDQRFQYKILSIDLPNE